MGKALLFMTKMVSSFKYWTVIHISLPIYFALLNDLYMKVNERQIQDVHGSNVVLSTATMK